MDAVAGAYRAGRVVTTVPMMYVEYTNNAPPTCTALSVGFLGLDTSDPISVQLE